MTHDLVIRPATEQDVPGTRRVLVETWHATYDALIGPERVDALTGRWHAAAVLRGEIALPDASFLVAEQDGEIVGHALARQRDAEELVLARLYVLPTHQRQGVGERLLAAVVERHPAARRLRLGVEAENPKALGFYRRQGFAVTGERVEDGGAPGGRPLRRPPAPPGPPATAAPRSRRSTPARR